MDLLTSVLLGGRSNHKGTNALATLKENGCNTEKPFSKSATFRFDKSAKNHRLGKRSVTFVTG